MSKFYITNFRIEQHIYPAFDTYEEAQDWVSKYVDRLAEEDDKRGISWDSVHWDIEQDDEN